MGVLNQKRSLFLLIVASFLLLLWIQIPKFGDEFRVDEDFRSFYWMRKFRDPALFPNDQLRSESYVAIPIPGGDLQISIYSPGYGLLFYAASFFVTPVLFSKLLPFLLLPISVWYLFRYGQSVRGTRLGATLAIGFVLLNLVSATSLAVTPGLQRSFSIPLMIALIYALHRRRFLVSAAVLMLAALVYPPAFMLGGITWGFHIVRFDCEKAPFIAISWEDLRPLLLTFVLGAIVLSPMLVPRFTQAASGHASVVDNPTEDEAGTVRSQPLWKQPTFSAEGRAPLFDLFPVIGRAGLVNKARNALHFMLLILVSGLIVLVRGRRAFDLPPEIWSVLGGGVVSYALSWAGILITSSFFLYMPSRFSRMTLFLFIMMFVLLNGEGFFREALVSVRLGRSKLIWLVVGFEIVALGLVLFYPAERSTLNGLNLKWILAPAALLLGVLSVVALRRPAARSPNLSRALRSPASKVLMGGIALFGLIGWLIYAREVDESSLLDPHPDERAMLAFLETLPKDVLLAGTPRALDNVPLLSGRQILFSREQIAHDDALTRTALEAYYSDDPQTVLDFCDSYGVDFLVVHREAYSDAYIEEGKIFYAPYNDPLLDYIADQDGFVLEEAAETANIFESGPYRVIPCSALRTVDP